MGDGRAIFWILLDDADDDDNSSSLLRIGIS